MASIKEECELRESLIGRGGVGHPRRQARHTVLPGRRISAVTAKMTFLGTFKTNVAMLCLARRLFVHHAMPKRVYCTDVHLRRAVRTDARWRPTGSMRHGPRLLDCRGPGSRQPYV